jgi:hypothetical protein
LDSTPGEDVNYEIREDGSLVLKSVREPDFGTYYCTIARSVVHGYVWSLEVERFEDFDVVSYI